MTGLNFVGNNDTTLNDTIDAVNQNNPTIHSNFGHQFGNVSTNLSEVNHAGQIETDGGHQSVIFWVLLGLCMLFFAWLCFVYRRKIWHKIVSLTCSKTSSHRSSEMCLKDKMELWNV